MAEELDDQLRGAIEAMHQQGVLFVDAGEAILAAANSIRLALESPATLVANRADLGLMFSELAGAMTAKDPVRIHAIATRLAEKVSPPRNAVLS